MARVANFDSLRLFIGEDRSGLYVILSRIGVMPIASTCKQGGTFDYLSDSSIIWEERTSSNERGHTETYYVQIFPSFRSRYHFDFGLPEP